MDYIVCQIGKSEAKKTAELNAYKAEILNNVKGQIDLYIHESIEEDTTV